MDDDYYSIESILAENQKVQCTFIFKVAKIWDISIGDQNNMFSIYLRALAPLTTYYICR